MQIAIYDHVGNEIDIAYNVESAISVLYGDLSSHDGHARRVVCPGAVARQLRYEAAINADCFGIPVDMIESV